MDRDQSEQAQPDQHADAWFGTTKKLSTVKSVGGVSGVWPYPRMPEKPLAYVASVANLSATKPPPISKTCP